MGCMVESQCVKVELEGVYSWPAAACSIQPSQPQPQRRAAACPSKRGAPEVGEAASGGAMQ